MMDLEAKCPTCGEVVWTYAPGMQGPTWIAHHTDCEFTHSVRFVPPENDDEKATFNLVTR